MKPEAQQFAEITGVSHETIARLLAFEDLLQKRAARQNLIAKGDLANLWHRHFLDSAQLLPLAPKTAVRFLDLGSGAGFPGLVLAIMLADRSGASVHLIESREKKCAFLREAVKLTGAAASVEQARIEEAPPPLPLPDVVTARALAPLPRLLALAKPFFGLKTIGLFPKGQRVKEELTQAERCWRLKFDLLPSQTDSRAAIVRVRAMTHVRA